MKKRKDMKRVSVEELIEMKKDIENFKYERSCKICFENFTNRVFLPCGHLVCCDICSGKVEYCPVCRKVIIARVTIQTNYRQTDRNKHHS
jgi:hypothetical protein